jgi:hypothetical protein
MPAKKTFTSIRVRGAAKFDVLPTHKGQPLLFGFDALRALAVVEDVPTNIGDTYTITPLFTVPVGKRAIITGAIVCKASASLESIADTDDATLDFISAGGWGRLRSNDLSTLINGSRFVCKLANAPLDGDPLSWPIADAGDVLQVTFPGTCTATVTIILFGYLTDI